jgi:hypothetical protein
LDADSDSAKTHAMAGSIVGILIITALLLVAVAVSARVTLGK